MYRRRKKSQFFDNVGSVVDGLVQKLRLEKGLKISSFSRLWAKIIGPRFEKTSKVFSITEYNGADCVNIAVASSSVAQDLIFYKNDILKKLHKIGLNFGFDIKDVSFSTKYWRKEEKIIEVQKRIPTDEELEEVQVPDDVIASLEATLCEEGFLENELKERFFKTIVNDLKRQIWHQENE